MNRDKILKYVSRISVILLISIGAFFTILVWIKGDYAVAVEPLRSKILDPFIITAYVAAIFCALFVIIFPLAQIIKSPKKTLKILIGIVAVVLFWYIIYTLSTGPVDPDILVKTGTSEKVARYVGAGLICTYIIFGIAILTTIYCEISKKFK